MHELSIAQSIVDSAREHAALDPRERGRVRAEGEPAREGEARPPPPVLGGERGADPARVRARGQRRGEPVRGERRHDPRRASGGHARRERAAAAEQAQGLDAIE